PYVARLVQEPAILPAARESFQDIDVDDSASFETDLTSLTDRTSGPAASVTSVDIAAGSDPGFVAHLTGSCDPLSTCKLVVDYNPTGTKALNHAAVLLHGTGSRPAIVTYDVVVHRPKLDVDGSDFGTQRYPLGTPVKHTVAITNNGDAAA